METDQVAVRRTVPAPAQIAGWVELAQAIADDADGLAMAPFRRDPTVTTKPDRTLVTEADTAIERMARSRILEAFPDHGVVAEEYGTDQGTAATRWYIDPIDGTHNYARGVPVFATLLAVEHDGELQAAVISAPALGSRWWAVRGGGAWAQSREDPASRRIRTSAVTAIGDAHVLYGDGRGAVASGLVPGFPGLLDAAWRERGFGDFWGYMLVAEGAGDVMLEVGLHPWDLAAPMLIVEEAGGRITDLDGARRLDAAVTIATNGHLHEEVIRRLLSPGEAQRDEEQDGASPP